MKKILPVLCFILISFALYVPQASLAYFVTDTTATRLNENTLLYTITYRLNYMKYDLRTPIGAVRGVEYGKGLPHVGYVLLKDGKITTEGEAYAVVLSQAAVAGKEYATPEGTAGYYTLTTFVRLPVDVDQAAHEYSVQMTSLPFTLIKEGTGVEEKSQIGHSELVKFYYTPGISL